MIVGRAGTARSIGAVLLLLWASPSQAKTLSVGPDETFKQPSEAVAKAADGDTIAVAPGEYFDCATLHQNNLTLVGTGPDVVLTDKTCQGKAILITTGNSITIRNLTLTRARVYDANGAGIRAEGKDLTVEGTRFINNESGILAGDQPGSTIRITDSLFQQNGKCDVHCAHGVSVGQIALLHIERTKFLEPRGGHQIKSNALRTELIDDDIEDGPKGASNYLVEIPNGGALVMRNNELEKGPHSGNLRAAVAIGDDNQAQPTAELVFEHNKFIDDTGKLAAFVLNWSETDSKQDQNSFKGGATEFSSQGYLWHAFWNLIGWVKSAVLGLVKLAWKVVKFPFSHL